MCAESRFLFDKEMPSGESAIPDNLRRHFKTATHLATFAFIARTGGLILRHVFIMHYNLRLHFCIMHFWGAFCCAACDQRHDRFLFWFMCVQIFIRLEILDCLGSLVFNSYWRSEMCFTVQFNVACQLFVLILNSLVYGIV